MVRLSRCVHEHTELYVLGQRRSSGRKRKESVPNEGICQDSAHPEDPAPRRRRKSTTTLTTTLNPDTQAAQGDPRVTDVPRTEAPRTDASRAARPKSFECAVCSYYKPSGVQLCARCLSVRGASPEISVRSASPRCLSQSVARHVRSEQLSNFNININITKEHSQEHLCQYQPVEAQCVPASGVLTNTHRNTGVLSRHYSDSFASSTVAGGRGGGERQWETQPFSMLPSTWSDDTGLTDSSPNTAPPDLLAKF